MSGTSHKVHSCYFRSFDKDVSSGIFHSNCPSLPSSFQDIQDSDLRFCCSSLGQEDGLAGGLHSEEHLKLQVPWDWLQEIREACETFESATCKQLPS
jgi:hypothetical protein